MLRGGISAPTALRMDLQLALYLVLAGLLAGFINTVAGGGSIITLPLLMFSGLTADVANGTNRVAILLQNVAATAGFRGKGIKKGGVAAALALRPVAERARELGDAALLDEAESRRTWDRWVAREEQLRAGSRARAELIFP